MIRPLAKAVEIAERFRAGMEKRPLFAKKGDTERGQLYIYETIGLDFWTGTGVTGSSVRDALKTMKDGAPLDIFINSEGGDVFEAKAIYEELKRFKGEKTVHIDGIAASAATFIAMAGDKIVTAPHATWMIHEAWSVAVGPAEDMRKMADVLDLQNRAIADIYSTRTKRPVDELLSLMAAETWMDAGKAKELGFTDEIREDEQREVSKTKAASPLFIAASQTQERIKSVSQGDLMRARAEMSKRNTNPGRGR